MLNNAIIAGRLVATPELRSTASGVGVTSFTIAVDRDRPEASGTRASDFIDIVAWRQLAEFICRYFVKGQTIIIQGRLQRRSWEDKQGGKHSAVEVVASEAYFAGKRDESGTLTTGDFADLEDDDGDFPF